MKSIQRAFPYFFLLPLLASSPLFAGGFYYPYDGYSPPVDDQIIEVFSGPVYPGSTINEVETNSYDGINSYDGVNSYPNSGASFPFPYAGFESVSSSSLPLGTKVTFTSQFTVPAGYIPMVGDLQFQIPDGVSAVLNGHLIASDFGDSLQSFGIPHEDYLEGVNTFELTGSGRNAIFYDLITAGRNISEAPEPGSVFLLGTGVSGILALIKLRRRRERKLPS